MTKRLAVVLVATAIGIVLASVASAYVRSTTSTATPLSWRDTCPYLQIDSTPNPGFGHDRLRTVLEDSAANWAGRLGGCSGIELSVLDGDVERPTVEYDGVNAVLWRLPGYCDDAHEDADVCASPNAAAITTVYYIDKPGSARDGEIVEADIVVNATNFEFTEGESDIALDLESVLTHELGHFLGLGHTCHATRGDVSPRADDGRLVPFCFPTTELSPETLTATMYNFVGPGETDKRTPLENELAGVCQIYAGHDGTCKPGPEGCGCRSSNAPGGTLLLLAVTAIAVGRRRPAPRSRRAR